MSENTGTAAADHGLVARLASKARGLSEQLKAATTNLDAAQKRNAELERQVTELGQRADTSAASKRVEELTAELRGLKHRQVFDRLAGKLDALPDALEDLWQLSGYKPEADAADEAGLEKLIGDVKAKKAYLFKPASGAEGAPPADGSPPAEPPNPGPAGGKGAPPAAPGKFAVKPSDVRSPQWWAANSKNYLEAVRANNVHWLSE